MEMVNVGVWVTRAHLEVRVWRKACEEEKRILPHVVLLSPNLIRSIHEFLEALSQGIPLFPFIR